MSPFAQSSILFVGMVLFIAIAIALPIYLVLKPVLKAERLKDPILRRKVVAIEYVAAFFVGIVVLIDPISIVARELKYYSTVGIVAVALPTTVLTFALVFLISYLIRKSYELRKTAERLS